MKHFKELARLMREGEKLIGAQAIGVYYHASEDNAEISACAMGCACITNPVFRDEDFFKCKDPHELVSDYLLIEDPELTVEQWENLGLKPGVLQGYRLITGEGTLLPLSTVVIELNDGGDPPVSILEIAAWIEGLPDELSNV